MGAGNRRLNVVTHRGMGGIYKRVRSAGSPSVSWLCAEQAVGQSVLSVDSCAKGVRMQVGVKLGAVQCDGIDAMGKECAAAGQVPAVGVLQMGSTRKPRPPATPHPEWKLLAKTRGKEDATG